MMNWRKKRKAEEDKGTRFTTASTENKQDGLEGLRDCVPCAGIVPQDYAFPGALTDLEKHLEDIVQEFLQNAEPDRFNGSYLDAQIEAVLKDTLKDLESQRASHCYTISSEIDGFFSVKERELAETLEDRKQELTEKEHELMINECILKRGTIYEDLFKRDNTEE